MVVHRIGRELELSRSLVFVSWNAKAIQQVRFSTTVMMKEMVEKVGFHAEIINLVIISGLVWQAMNNLVNKK